MENYSIRIPEDVNGQECNVLKNCKYFINVKHYFFSQGLWDNLKKGKKKDVKSYVSKLFPSIKA